MLKTEHRPAPLPPRADQPASDGARRPKQTAAASRDEDGDLRLPGGASHFAWIYLGPDGKTVKAKQPVPVNDAGQITHVEYECTDCPSSGRWVSAKAKTAPICPTHKRPLRQVVDRRGGGQAFPWQQVWQSVRLPVRGFYPSLVAAGWGAALDADVMSAWSLTLAPAVVFGADRVTRLYLTRQAERSGKVDPKDEVAGKRRRKLIEKRGRYATYCASIGCAWVGLADLIGLTGAPGVVSWGALAAAALAAPVPWWRHVRPRPTDPIPPTTGQPAATDAIADASDWAATVAVSGGLPGTAVDLATWQADEGGRRMVIRNQARRGALTDERIRAALPLIAGAFDVSRSAIGWVEEYEGSPNAALLLVQPNSPLNDKVDWKGIDVVDPKRAVAHMGKRIDGTDLVTRLFTPGWGAPSRLLLGTKGAGKTETLRLLLAAFLKARVLRPDGTPTRLIAPFLHDPKRGADYGAFRRQVCGFSTDRDTLHMIVDAVIREMERRYDALANIVWTDEKGRQREGERPFDPTTMGPIISLVIDEFHEPAKDTALMAKFEPMSRKMRAAGIEINAATHLATIGDTGSQGFRDMLAGGEAWLLRTTMGLNAALATGGTLTGDPRALPRAPGMLLHASGEDVTMQARAAYVEEMYDLLYDDDNQSRIQPVDWPAETLEAFGPDFVQWMEESQRRPLGAGSAPPPPSARRAASAQVQSDDREAFDVLLEILLDAEGKEPLNRKQIMEDGRWGYSLRTLSNCLKAGQGVESPMLRKAAGASGAYELTEFGAAFADLERRRREAASDEAKAADAEAAE